MVAREYANDKRDDVFSPGFRTPCAEGVARKGKAIEILGSKEEGAHRLEWFFQSRQVRKTDTLISPLIQLFIDGF